MSLLMFFHLSVCFLLVPYVREFNFVVWGFEDITQLQNAVDHVTRLEKYQKQSGLL